MMVRVVSLFTMDVSTHCVSATYSSRVFGVWLGLVRLWAARTDPVLYPPGHSCDALPK